VSASHAEARRAAAVAPVDDADDAPPPVTRMGVALLSLVGLFLSAYLSLFKLGIIGTLTCQVGSCDRVQSSPWAVFLGVPVPYLGVAGYVGLLSVALIGLQPRFVRERWVALALFAMAGVGVAFSAYLTYLEAFRIRAWCMWCVISAILMTLIFLLTIPGLRRAR
jgi:uncharacterized membrane protein